MEIETPPERETFRIAPRPAHTGLSLFDAAPRPAGARVQAAPPLLRHLLEAGDDSTRRQLVREAVAALGFQSLGSCWVTLRHAWPEALPGEKAWTDGDWVRQYLDEAFFEIDPRMHEATQTGVPCVWHVDELERRAPLGATRARVARFVSALRLNRMNSGVLFALPGHGLHERHMVGLLSLSSGSHWINDRVLQQAWAVAFSVHQCQLHQGATASSEDHRAGLTAVQQHILSRLVTGESDKAIAAGLGLSLHKVDYHMRLLRKRFGVRNRLQLSQGAARLLAR